MLTTGMLCGNCPPVAGFWHYAYDSWENFKNLNVKHWILVHFHAENCDILHWVPKYNVNESLIYAWKSGGQKAFLDPAVEKIDPLNPVLPQCMLKPGFWVSVFRLPYVHFSSRCATVFLANVNSRSRSLYAIARPSVCRLSVCRLSVCRLSVCRLSVVCL